MTMSQLRILQCFHRDLKPDNILIEISNGIKKYILTDFGESKEELISKTITEIMTFRGSKIYLAPELFRALKNKD